jgi:hypothetical protein
MILKLHPSPKVEALANAVQLLRRSKDWDKLLEDEWETLQHFLEQHGNAGSHQHAMGFAIISVQKKLMPLRQAIRDDNTDDLNEILNG